MFQVGMKVTPKNSDEWEDSEYEDEVFPTFGEVYTIRAIELDGEVYLRLCEIKNPQRNYDDGLGEIQFLASEFVPVVESKTDISFALEILRKASKKQPLKVTP